MSAKRPRKTEVRNTEGDEDSEESMHELDMIAEFKKREEKMQTELSDKQQEIEKLK